MFREFFLLLFLAHIVSDFYFQTEKVARKKEDSMKWVILHCLCYWFTTIGILLPVISLAIFRYGTIAAITHLIIDVTKFRYVSCAKEKITMVKERNLFLIDQFLHVICLIVISYLFVKEVGKLNLWDNMADFFTIIGVPGNILVSWITVLLIIHKPANITISKLLMLYRPLDKEDNKKIRYSAGKSIGSLERILILIFISIGQYSAIGLVLTAKSIARYDRISKEKEFAEYYLLGTLFSTAIAIIVSFLVL